MSSFLRTRYAALHNQFGPAGLILSVLAVVLALAGGAIAANHSATASTAKAGKRGPKGPPGPEGKQGLPGANGKEGPEGKPGAPGESVTASVAGKETEHCKEGGSKFVAGASTTYACNGKNGKNGEAGAPGEPGPEGEPGAIHPGETLPKGATETGTFATATGSSVEHEFIAISFAIPLPEPIERQRALYVTAAEQEEGTQPTGCHGGTVEEPKAEEGYLCIYQGETFGPLPDEETYIYRPQTLRLGAAVAGAIVNFAFPIEQHQLFGAWAVTAA